MKNIDLSKLLISVTDFKKNISDIINSKETKVVIKNNEPVSIFMPYSEYLSMDDKAKATGEEITLSNGITIKVCVEVDESDPLGEITIKTYTKMKDSDEFKLYFTHHLGAPPNVE